MPSMKSLIQVSCKSLLDASPKKIILSGPSGFLGSKVLDTILKVHNLRQNHGVKPGELILLSSSPGRLMERLHSRYGVEKMKTVRASRVDYYTQHDIDIWTDQLGSLGLEGPNSVFVNLAAVAGPVVGIPDAMMDVNYKAPIAAARACQHLGFGHWVQSSTQATNAERAGQVPYSRAKAMTDFALSRLSDLPVSIACLGLLYNRKDGMVGQDSGGKNMLNLIDLSLLPLTPIMGDGSAPLQPQEVHDAAERLAFLALTDPRSRPVQTIDNCRSSLINAKLKEDGIFRVYDAVGPETLTMIELLRKFAYFQGNNSFRPVHIGYRNMEKVLNVKSLGNLNRQFVSLLRSEQDSDNPIIGNSEIWEKLLGDDAKLMTLNDAFLNQVATATNGGLKRLNVRTFPYITTIKWVYNNPGVIKPGFKLSLEILKNAVFSQPPVPKKSAVIEEKK